MTAALPEPDRTRQDGQRGRAALRWSMLVAIGLAVGAATWLLSQPGPLPPAPAPEGQRATADVASQPRPAASAPVRTSSERAAPTAAIRTRSDAPSGAALPQGLLGRLVDEDGAPLAGVAVHLIESPGDDPVMTALAPQRRQLLAPITSTESDADGTFSLGLRVAEERRYDLYVRSPAHAFARRAGLRVLPATWHDLGDLVLQSGTTLRGRVTVAGRPQLPAPDAVVRVTAGGTFTDEALQALSGESGLIAHADGDGYYELRHAPTRGVIEVSALAPGFARVTRRDVELHPERPVVVDFALPTGAALTGVVRDPDGAPVEGAQVTVWPNGPDATPLAGASDTRGGFSVHGLHPDSRPRVEVRAPGFAVATEEGVELASPLLLTLHPMHRVRIRVENPRGAVLRSYRLALRRFFPSSDAPADAEPAGSGHLGAVREVPDRRVRLDRATDEAEVVGVPAGLFVAEVRAKGWAKTFSAPFQVADGDGSLDAAERILVVVNAGSTLSGRVVDARGRALAGATVSTQAPGALPDNPLLHALQRATPARITPRVATTDERGRFTLEQLSCAAYQLQIEHPDACRSRLRGIDLKLPQNQYLGDIQLQPGAAVKGTARRLDGRSRQIRVILTTSEAAPADQSMRLETVTDGEGAYAFPRRIAPGDYVLRCAEVGGAGAESEIFQQMVQLKKSTKTFSVTPGQEIVELHLVIPAN